MEFSSRLTPWVKMFETIFLSAVGRSATLSGPALFNYQNALPPLLDSPPTLC